MTEGDGASRRDDAVARYRALLQRYHRTLDLMSDRGLADLERLIVDAEAYAGAVRDATTIGLILDFGTGAGLPAVVIAARNPERPMIWVERRRRRTAFLEMVAATCGLRSVTVVGEDVRSLRPADLDDRTVSVITAQGVGGWKELYGATRPLHAATVTMIARRGTDWAEEAAAFAADVPDAAIAVTGAVALESGGTLVALQVGGEPPCPSSE